MLVPYPTPFEATLTYALVLTPITIRYITIGDPYVGTKEKIPERWKAKQFHCDRIPQNAGAGYFGYGGKQFTYVSDPYTETSQYMKVPPHTVIMIEYHTHTTTTDTAARRSEKRVWDERCQPKG